jgi:hypothetical protein
MVPSNIMFLLNLVKSVNLFIKVEKGRGGTDTHTDSIVMS